MATHSLSPTRRAFSLVELSIVLVILGLLTGGILAGKSLIRSSEIKASMRDVESFRVAIHTFRSRYFFFPGDLPDPTRFWPDVTNTNGAAYGDWGNGAINTGHNRLEDRYAWQQLKASALFPSTVHVNNQSGNLLDMVPGLTIPHGRFSRSGISIEGSPSGNADRPHFLRLGRKTDSTANIDVVNSIYGGVLTIEEMQLLDIKYDDGRPGRGSLQVRNWGCLLGCSGPENMPYITHHMGCIVPINTVNTQNAVYESSSVGGEQCSPLLRF